MDRKTALALLIAAAAGSALAEDGTIEPPRFVPSASRTQVMAELQQFRQDGHTPWADDYNPIARFRSERTRAEVSREYIDTREAVAALNGEDSGSMYLARRDGSRMHETELAAAPAMD